MFMSKKKKKKKRLRLWTLCGTQQICVLLSFPPPTMPAKAVTPSKRVRAIIASHHRIEIPRPWFCTLEKREYLTSYRWQVTAKPHGLLIKVKKMFIHL